MDYFTKWPESYPISDQEASTVAKVLFQHWISKYGVPLHLPSDQRRNFDSVVCKRLCEIFGINQTRTTALHPQSDGMVERFNRTILNIFLSWYLVVNKTWTTNCLFSCLPTEVPFTRPPAFPLHRCSSDLIFVCLLFSRPPDAPLAPKECVEKLQARMEEMHPLARDRISMASEKMKTRYDALATGHDFHEDDKVWVMEF
ncbi:retrovirus-related Pol polyprotein from transposon 412 [Trichonephila clavipes]|nr:retrovirus-related Pol polyprotein from transposon 412 [Trichonephila clavipes]